MSSKHVSKSAAEWLANALSNEQLFRILRIALPLAEELLRGHKMSPAGVGKKIVRKRIAAEIARTEDFLDLIFQAEHAPWAEWQLALEALDTEWVIQNWCDIARAAGPTFIAALAVSDDPDLEERGRRALRTRRPWQTTEPGQESVPHTLPDALAALRAGLSHSGMAAAEAAGPDRTNARKAEQRASAAEKERDKLSDALAKLRERLKHAESTAADFERQLESQNKLHHQKLREAADTYRELETGFNDKLREAINAFKREHLGVSPDIERVQVEIQTDATAPILEHVREVLDEHARLNEKYGTISRLEAEIAELREAREELLRCLAQSVRVAPSLHSVMEAVNQRIDTLQAILPNWQEPTLSAPAQRLMQQVLNIPLSQEGLAELARLDRELGAGLVCELLGADDVATIQRTVHKRRRQIEALQFEEKLVEHLDVPGLPEPPPHVQPVEPGEVGRAVERTDKPVVLFVDGYNAIMSAAPYRDVKAKRSLESARELFLEHCRRKTAGFENLEVVFDGRGALSERETLQGLTVVFAADLAESQNADNYIVARMRHEHSLGHDHELWLVTADGGLRARVAGVADALIDPDDFAAFLEDAE